MKSLKEIARGILSLQLANHPELEIEQFLREELGEPLEVLEAPVDFKYDAWQEDGGQAKIMQVDQGGDSPLFVRIQSSRHEEEDTKHTQFDALLGKKLRVIIAEV